MSVRLKTGLAFTVLATLAFTPGVAGNDLKNARKNLKAALEAKDDDGAVEAVAALGQFNNLEVTRQLVSLALEVESKAVFEAVETALAEITENKAFEYMIKTAKSKDWRLRALMAKVFGKVDADSARTAILELLSDKQEVVIREAVRAAAAQGKTRVFVPALIELLERRHKEQGLTWVEVRKALIALTGEDYEEPEDWKKAWQTQKEEMDSEKKKPKKKKDEGDGPGFRTVRMKKPPKFFGSDIYSKRLLFLIDVSTSMKIQEIPFIGETRLELVQIELCRCIDALDNRARFNIIAFSDRVTRWKRKPGRSALAAATKQNRRAAKKFVSKLQPRGHTYTDEALKAAMDDPDVDTIVLLSDGAPYRPSAPREPLSQTFIDSILKRVEIDNRFRKIIVNTFGFESLEEDEKGKNALDFLKDMAALTGGRFKGIKLDQE